MPDDEELVSELVAAHRAHEEYSALLAEARKRRRQAASELRTAGHSYRWIGAQIGVTAQAVEGFVKYRQRHRRS